MFGNLRRIVQRQNDYLYRRAEAPYLSRRFDSTHHRHTDVHEDQIRFQGHCFFDSFLPVFRLSANVQGRVIGEDALDAFADDLMIIHH